MNTTNNATQPEPIITRTQRVNGKCRTCKRGFSRVRTFTTQRWERYTLCGFKSGTTVLTDSEISAPEVTCCGRRVSMIGVKGVYNPSKKCDARCTDATGHNCECKCGGKNHGAGHEVVS